MEGLKFRVATAASRTQKVWKNISMSWKDIINKIENPIRTNETVAEYRAMSKADRDIKKDVGGFVGGYLKDGIRKKGHLEARQLVCLDADNIPSGVDFPGIVKEKMKLMGTYALYSTHSHTPGKPRFRLVIPLMREVTAEEYEPLARFIANDIGIDMFDPTTYQDIRLMYWPSVSSDGEYISDHAEPLKADGSGLHLYSPDVRFTCNPNWQDATTWPTASTEAAAHKKVAKKLGDPREKPGLIGLFCQAYTVEEAMETFLPEVYTRVDGCENRWTFAGGSTTGGVIVYDGTEQTPTWADYDPAKLTIGGDTAGTNAGTYTATFTPTANYKWADGTTTAKSVTWEISAATVTIPTVTDTSKTYNGGSQAPTVTGLDTQTVDVIDDATAINAGSYMITFRLKSASLIWADETTSDKSFAWTIGPKAVTAPTVTGTSFTYDGTSQGPTIGSYDTDAILVSGTTEAVGAGNYSVIFSLVSAVNYKWSDDTTEPKSVAWAIDPATVAVPALSNKSKTYNGSAQSPTVSPYDSNLVEVTGTTTATNAGSYTVTFHLLNPNVTWADETTADKTDTWEIAKAAGSLTLSKNSVSLNTTTTSDTVTVTKLGDGAITAVSSNTSYATVSVSGDTVTITGVATGSATVTISVGEGTNYLAPTSKTVSVAVQFISNVLNDNSWATIQQVAQSGQADNYWDVGDRKEVILNGTVRARTLSNYKWYCYILGYNHNAAIEGNNTIHFQFGFNALSGGIHVAMTNWTGTNAYGGTSGVRFCMNDTSTNIGGWGSSLMRTTIIPEFKNCLPSDLKSVLKAVTKYTDNTGNLFSSADKVTATQDNIFLLAEYEIFGSITKANQYEYTNGKQAQYDYYKSGNSKKMYNDQSTGNVVIWWMRSPYQDDSQRFCCVGSGGAMTTNLANSSSGFAPGFCVG